jgi:outer membrane protein TolC
MRYQSILCAAVLALFAGWDLPALAVDPGDTGPVDVPAEGAPPSPDADADTEPGGAADSQPWGGSEANTLTLSLQEAIELGLQNNLGVQIQRFNPLIAEEDLRIAWGAYDPIWESELGWNKERLPSSFTLDGTELSTGKTLDGEGGFVGLLPLLSTQYSAKLASQRVTSNSSIQSLSPEYRSTTIFSVTQPLLRDLIWNEPWTRVKVSTIGYESSREAFRLDVMNIVAGTEDAYWNLIATHEEMLVAEKSLETARALLDQTQIQYEVGVVSRVEVVQSEAGVADREFRLIVAKNRYRQSQDDLIDLVLGEQLRPETTLAIEPTDRAGDYVTYDVDVEESTRVAFENRPELTLANQEIERLIIQEKFAKNQRLPRFDVTGSYYYQGLSGRQNPDNDPSCRFVDPVAEPRCDPTNPAFDPAALAAPRRNYGDSYNDFYDSNGANNWAVGGFFSIPIPNTSARHRYTQAQIELRQTRTQKRRVELDIIVQIRAATRNIRSSQQGIEAALRGVAAAAEQLRAEQIRLEYGESTPFDVLLREDDLVQFESQKITAFQVYRSSLTALDRQQGTILRNRNIAIDEVMTLR